MAITTTFRAKVYSTSGASSYATDSTYTPGADSLIVAFVVGCSTSVVDPNAATPFSGHGLSWTKLTLSANGISTTHAVSVWVAVSGSSPSSAACTAAWTTNRTGCAIIEFEVTRVGGFVGTASNFIVQNPTNTGTGTSGSVTLGGVFNSADRPISFFCHLANEVTTPRTNWTESANADGNFNNPATGAEGQFRNDAYETTASATWSSNVAWRGVALEILDSVVPADTNTLSDGTPEVSLAETVQSVAVNDTNTLSDELTTLHIGLLPTDTNTLSDDLTTLHIGLLLDDTNILSDDASVDLIAAASELTVTSSDSLNNWSDTESHEFVTSARVSQLVIEVHAVPTSQKARVSQLTVEILVDIFGIDCSDSFTLSDALNQLYLGLELSANDSISLSDDAAISLEGTFFNYEVTVDDTITQSDLIEIIYSYNLDLLESISLSDSVDLYGDLYYAESDQLSLSDFLSLEVGLILDDYLVLTDSIEIISGDTTLSVIVSDSFSLTDLVELLYSTIINISDALTLSDFLAPNYFFGNEVSDQLVITDGIALKVGDRLSISDSFDLSDIIGIGYGLLRYEWLNLLLDDSILLTPGNEFNDTIELSDSLSLFIGLVIDDSLTLTDELDYSVSDVILSESLSDTLVISDDLLILLGNTFVDQIVLSDSLLLHIGLILSEVFTLGDAAILEREISCEDDLNSGWVDVTSNEFFYPFIFEELNDYFTLLDSLSLSFDYGAVEIADVMEMLDGIQHTFPLYLDDSFNLSDSLVLSPDPGLNIYDSMFYGIMDEIALTFSGLILLSPWDQLFLYDSNEINNNIYAGEFEDSIFLTDSVTMSILTQPSLEDSITYLDRVDLVVSMFLEYSDQLSLSDYNDNNFSNLLSKSFGDTMNLLDGFTNDSNGYLMNSSQTGYLRRYLNDVVGR